MLTPITSQVQSIIKIIREANTSTVVRPTTVLHDVFILPNATQRAWNEALLEYSRISQSLDLLLAAKTNDTLLVAIAEALDLSYNQTLSLISTTIERRGYDIVGGRKAATYAEGFAKFYTDTLPAADALVPSGQQVETVGKTRFTTTYAATLPAASAADYYDAALNAYAVSVLVRCQAIGTAGQIAAGTLTYFTDDNIPSGFTGVTNLVDFTTGYAEETDDELVARIKTTLAGLSQQSSEGMKAVILNNTILRDIFVADAQSAYQLRNNGEGGVVDLYTPDTIPQDYTETFTGGAIVQVLSKQPVLSILSISGYTEGTDFELIKDYNTLTKGSVVAQDSIKWLTPPPATYTCVYSYNYAPTLMQATITADKYRPVMGDVTQAVLSREGIKIRVKIQFKVILSASALLTQSRETIITNAKTAVQEYVSALTFGETLAPSDIIGVLEGVSGIDYVTTTPVYFCVYNEETASYGANQDLIVPAGNEYIRAKEILLS